MQRQNLQSREKETVDVYLQMILIFKLAKTLTQVELNIFRKIDENRQNKEMRSTNNNQLDKEEHRVSENKNSLIKIYRCIKSI